MGGKRVFNQKGGHGWQTEGETRGIEVIIQNSEDKPKRYVKPG